MTRTYRMNDEYKKVARDGVPYRGCGDKYCGWCVSDRTNNTRRVRR